MEYGNDIDDGIFDFKHYGNTVSRPAVKWREKARYDLIEFNKAMDDAELAKGLKIGASASLTNTHKM